MHDEERLPQMAVRLRGDLVDKLTVDGALQSPQWVAAFAAVPRHVFARRFWWRPQPGPEREFIDGTDPQQATRWLAAVYSDDSLATQLDEAGTATSSSSQPSLMATMLEALAVEDGADGSGVAADRVLEIGTGTGYNAALLCHRLGNDRVTSIEIDPDVAREAATALAAADMHPTLIVGDGLKGHPARAPYDRIMATCSVSRVPAAWAQQIEPGGIVMANIGMGVAVLRADEHQVLRGQLLPGFAGFMEARTADAGAPFTADQAIELCGSTDGSPMPATVDEDLADDEFLSFLQITLPGLTRFIAAHDEQGWTRYGWADRATRSWALAEQPASGPATARQDGSRRLWDEISTVRDRWIAADRPQHDQIGLTIDSSGRHEMWIDEPTSAHRWTLV
ncbi:methyltransferase domain-containing protein [Catenuloplanes sp. NPDC051500]|uniref:methyltransferase domain-containing protein n=1 Tax=Catenuloplanes sp. NPDC051500 TaxID=3363959 RepID=UPI003788DD57